MRYVPVSEACLHLVRDYLEGDRRTLIAVYDGEDCRSHLFVRIHPQPWSSSCVGALMKSWNASGSASVCLRSPLTRYVINVVPF